MQVDFNTFHINGEGSGEKGAVKQHTAGQGLKLLAYETLSY
jgi:hypothetical protein